MGYLVVVCLLFLGVYLHKKNNNWSYPGALYCYLWSIICLSASLRLFDINAVSMKTWIIIFLGSISFIIGCKAIIRIRPTRENISYVYQSVEERKNILNTGLISKRAYYVLFIIVAIFLFYELRQTINLLSKGYTLDRIRAASFGTLEINGYILKTDTISILRNRILSALQTILIAVGIEYFVKRPKQNWYFMVFSLFLVIADAISDGGRWGVVYFIVEILVCYELLDAYGAVQSISLSKKTKRRIYVILIGLFATLIALTNSRWAGDVRKHFYAYLCGCIPLLDLKISEIESSGFYSIVLGGQYGIWSFFVPIIQKMFGINFEIYHDTLSIVMTGQQFYDIGGNTAFNAFVTSFYYLYADLRIIGVIFGMFLFGLIAGNIYRRTPRSDNFGILAPYLLVSQMIIKTLQTYPLTSNLYVWVLAILLVVYPFRKNQSFKE